MTKLSIGVNVHLCEPHKFSASADTLSKDHVVLTIHGTEYHYPNVNLFFEHQHSDRVRIIASLLNEISASQPAKQEAA